MAPEDMLRELEKIQDALRWAVRHHALANESNAALHCNEKVFYSPLTTRLLEAQASAQMLGEAVEEG